MLCGPRSLSQPNLLNHASPTQRVACVSCLFFHSFIDFLRSEQLFVIGKGATYALMDRLFALECQNVGQKGFNALIHGFPRYFTCGPPMGL